MYEPCYYERWIWKYQLNIKHLHKNFLTEFDKNRLMMWIFYDLSDQSITKKKLRLKQARTYLAKIISSCDQEFTFLRLIIEVSGIWTSHLHVLYDIPINWVKTFSSTW